MIASASPLLSSLVRRVARSLPARPPVRGRRHVPGLRSDVRIDYTEGGIPHLWADSAADLFFAQGYVTAADRLFQMDLVRRMARGELSEVFGDRPAPWEDTTVLFRGWSLVDVDHFMRQLGLIHVARASLEGLTPDAQGVCEAYAAGVNAFLAEGPRPLEAQLLGYRPRAWTAADCVLVLKLLGFQLSYGWRAGLTAEALRARFPGEPNKARALVPDQRDVADAMLPVWPGAASALVKLEIAAGKRSPSGPSAGGSNAWAVAPARSATRRALLCGDPHLPLQAPSPGYLVHLNGGGYDVAGWSAPGLPGVLMGHNADAAWSLTSGCTLDATWAMEQLGTDGESVRTREGFAPLDTHTTDIFVRGEKAPVRRRVRHSPNGPLFEGALIGEAPRGMALALRWTGHLPTSDVDGVLGINRARSFADVREAASRVGSPAVNLVYADREGHIGWQFIGVAPRFKGTPPLGAVPGWSEAHEWNGIEPFESLPWVLDPADGLVVSANQKLLGNGSLVQLGEVFEPPYRARRIRQRLEPLREMTLDQAASVQLDRFSLFGVEVRDRFVRPLADRLAQSAGTPTPEGRAVLERIAAWDGHADPDSAGAAAFWAFVPLLMRELFEPLLGERLFHAVFEQHNLPLLPLARVLADRGAPFFTPEALDAAALGALDAAGRLLVARGGRAPGRWRLGLVRRVAMRHALSEVPLLGRLFTVGPVEWGGDGSTVNCASARLDRSTDADVGPAFRHAVECGAWDDYRVVLATGQGGDPTTMRYREMFDRWLRGDFFRLPFSADAVTRARQSGAVLGASPKE